MTDPTDPIAAATHPDPYPYYARLVAEQPIYRDPAIGSWVITSAEVMTAVLTNTDCRVRPVDEPVPGSLRGSTAGEIFGGLVRMRDGGQHQPLKEAIAATLATIDPAQVASLSRGWARTLVDGNGNGEIDIVHALSVYVIGSLLGIPDDQLGQTAGWMSAFVRCLSPVSTPEQIEQGTQAAERLWSLFEEGIGTPASESLLGTLDREAAGVGCRDTATVIANGIGLLFQTHDATAGLIGNTLVALARHDNLRDRLAQDHGLLDRVIAEVLRYDPPIQNTRRYVATETQIAGHRLQAGDSILVVLAAANRDPAANANPNCFDPDRTNRQVFTFGAGPHTCPGRMPAATIALAGVEALLDAGLLPGEPIRYHPSANARIPVVQWNRSSR